MSFFREFANVTWTPEKVALTIAMIVVCVLLPITYGLDLAAGHYRRIKKYSISSRLETATVICAVIEAVLVYFTMAYCMFTA